MLPHALGHSQLVNVEHADEVIAGVLGPDHRLRGVYDWRTPKGFIADLYAEYRSLFIANNFYTGGSLPVVFGDRFYTTHRYNRLDLGWRPLRSGDLDGSFTLSFHFAPGTIDNQQQLTLRYRIGKRYVKQR